ncbi:UNVERIFIED_CONTAM: hypothetical protein Scaly_1928800 [Sesamum calycinum]|uniref:Uncharacterized protein n=1 Tax=Sesamum calycinum TaxID=2727403 RepID=A0AAW2NF69_9LAMI
MEITGAVERPMMEYSFPTADGTICSIAKPNVEANNFEIKPLIIQIIRSIVQFSSLPDEDLNKHLINFLEICDTFKFSILRQMTALKHMVNNSLQMVAAIGNGVPIGPCGACGQNGAFKSKLKADTRFQNQEASIRNLKVQVGQLVSLVSRRKEGQLPSDTEKNPMEQVNAITVKSGNIVGHDSPKEQVGEAQVQKEEETKGSPLKLNLDDVPPSRAWIDVQKGQLTLKVNDEHDIKEKHEEVPSFVHTGQEVKSKLQKGNFSAQSSEFLTARAHAPLPITNLQHYGATQHSPTDYPLSNSLPASPVTTPPISLQRSLMDKPGPFRSYR